MGMKENRLDGLAIPKHVAFIMDGNGRWARAKGKKRTTGHREGSRTLKNICKVAYELGVEYVTVYAFSTENWKRSDEEVAFLMRLLRQYLKESVQEAEKNNMRIKVIGHIEGLPRDIQDKIELLEKVSIQYDGLKLQIALNYGGRDEIVRAIKKINHELETDVLQHSDINEDLVSRYLDTSGIPDPDLMIRTSGEVRLSNFLLWQLAYTEFYFTEKYWPDFDKNALEDAIIKYNETERRFGGLADET
ncbi:MAG: isoprenyl transferase [Vallitaleaceae bacterium]|jgi:undecaprenyl diphosphate synthase|nr:isoprenyl transferase [Vallitaleaceae bacterium]